jgi:hypothetical protein
VVRRSSRSRPVFALRSVRCRPPEGTATLTQAVVDDLQRPDHRAGRPVDVLAQAQANLVGFSKVGNDFVFAPATGNVEIKAPMMLTIQGGAATIRLLAGANLEQKGALIKLN